MKCQIHVLPDQWKLFYVIEIGQPAENRHEPRTAQVNGQDEIMVYTGGITVTHDWNPNSEVFAYQASREAAVTVSQLNGSVGKLPDTINAYWFSWVEAVRFLFS